MSYIEINNSLTTENDGINIVITLVLRACLTFALLATL